jgi:hypothetical protein
LTGCFNPFAPELENIQDLSKVITEQQTAGEVLQNFQYAYTFKDSLLYSDVIETSFVFEYFDPNLEPSGAFVTWGRDIDLRSTGRLFRNFDTIDLKVDTLFTEKSQSDEKQFTRFTLSLLSQDLNFFLTGTAVFTFRKNPDDGKWRIVRWKDESDL